MYLLKMNLLNANLKLPVFDYFISEPLYIAHNVGRTKVPNCIPENHKTKMVPWFTKVYIKKGDINVVGRYIIYPYTNTIMLYT